MANDRTPKCPAPRDPFWQKYYVTLLCETGDADTAAELTQQLQVQLIEWRSRYAKPLTNLEGFVNVACARLLVDWLRRKIRDQKLQPLDESTTEQSSSEPSPEEALALEEWREVVRRELDQLRLSAQQRTILEHWDESAEELARRLGTTAATVRTSRCKLRKRLQKNHRLRALLRRVPPK